MLCKLKTQLVSLIWLLITLFLELYFQKYALYLRKRGKKHEVVPIVDDLRKEYTKAKKHVYMERSIRLSFMELLLIQVNKISSFF